METLQAPLKTISGKILKEGTKVKISFYKNKIKVTSSGRSSLVEEKELLKALVPKVTAESLIENETNGMKLKCSKVRLKSIVQKTVGKVTAKTERKARAVIANYIDSHKLCPRCSTQMVKTTLASGMLAWNCPNDRVTLPIER